MDSLLRVYPCQSKMLQVKLRVKWKVWGLHSFKVSRRYKTWSKQSNYYNSHTPGWEGRTAKEACKCKKVHFDFSRSIIFLFLRITVTLMFLISRYAYSISKPSAYDADESDASDVLNHDHLPGVPTSKKTTLHWLHPDEEGQCMEIRQGSSCGFWSNLIAWTSYPKFRK